MATRQLAGEAPAENVRELQDLALRHLWVPLREPSEMAEQGDPAIFVGGEGVRVTDIEGKTYIDARAGAGVVNVGHGRSEIAEAAYEQMRRLIYPPTGTVTVGAIELAARLAKMAAGPLTRTFFTSGGSEAVETALKMARAYHHRRGDKGRYKVITRKGSYHGSLGATMWMGGAGYARAEYEPAYPGMLYAPQPNPYRCEYGGQTPEQCAVRCAEAVEELIVFHDPDTVAAVVGEPIASYAGAAVPGPQYWPMVREICDRYGVLLIADEVFTGFGRTGKMFGLEHWGVVPDLMTFAKGVTSGYVPMGGVIATTDVAAMFAGSEKAVFHHVLTFGGHPAACAAALTNLDIIEAENLVENAARMGQQLLDGLREIQPRHPTMGDVRGKGLTVGVELVMDRDSKERWPAEARLAPRLAQRYRDNGVMLPMGGDAIRFAPPLCITRSEVEELVSVTDEVLGSVEQDLAADSRPGVRPAPISRRAG